MLQHALEKHLFISICTSIYIYARTRNTTKLNIKEILSLLQQDIDNKKTNKKSTRMRRDWRRTKKGTKDYGQWAGMFKDSRTKPRRRWPSKSGLPPCFKNNKVDHQHRHHRRQQHRSEIITKLLTHQWRRRYLSTSRHSSRS